MSGQDDQAEMQALLLATLARRVGKGKDALKLVIERKYKAGDKRTFRAPHGQKLGSVYRTDPTPEWRVTNDAALRARLAELYPGVVETVDEIAVDDEQMVIDVLKVHAPHLLCQVTRVSDEAVQAALEASREADRPVAEDGEPLPGITKLTSTGTLTVLPADNAEAVVERMVALGSLDWRDLLALPNPETPESGGTAT